jgi:hypothetical protein
MVADATPPQKKALWLGMVSGEMGFHVGERKVQAGWIAQS